MLTEKFDLHNLTRNIELVAAVVPASRVFGVLTKSIDLPPFWAALVTTVDGAQMVCKAGREVHGKDAEEVMLLRTNPQRLEVLLNQLPSRDGYLCNTRVELQVQLIAEKSELAAFRKTVAGSRPQIFDRDLSALLAPALADTIRAYVLQHDAAELVAMRELSDAVDSIRAGLQATLFESGLSLENVSDLTIDSKAHAQWQQQRVELQRQQQYQRSQQQLKDAMLKAQADHLSHLQASLGQLQELADASPEMAFAELLTTFDESQRGQLYQALWQTTDAAGQTDAIVVACGEELLFYDPESLEAPARRLRLAGPAGPLRSLSLCCASDSERLLLVGAASGVHLVDAASGDCAETFLARGDQGKALRGGFNAVALVGEQLYATHSELGLVRWCVDEPGESFRLLESVTSTAKTVRHVQFAAGKIWLSIDDQVHAFAPTLALAPQTHDEHSVATIYKGSKSPITALLCSEGRILAGNAEGEILQWPLAENSAPAQLYCGSRRAVESIHVLATSGLDRLFFTDTSSALHGQVMGDVFSCRYQAGGQTIRRSAVAADLIVATNEHRDRLFCWPTHEPAAAPRTVVVSKITGRSIQDVCLQPRRG